MNVSEQLLSILKKNNVSRIYGVTGDALNHFVKAIEEDDAVEWIGMKHEENAAFAAFGESSISGKLAVCAGTVGPGALHLINGLYNAKKERTSVLAITGQIPQKYQGSDYFQEVDLKKVYDDVCEYQAIIESPAQAVQTIQKAINIAINQQTVCRVELAANVAEMDAEGNEFLQEIFSSQAKVVPSDPQITETAALIKEAKTIGILAGFGCKDARNEVLSLSKKINAPITHTLRASDIFDHDTENVAGLSGLIGNPSGFSAVMNCELLLMLGTNFPYVDFLPHKTKTIQVDIRPKNIGNRTPVHLGIHADIKSFVEKLLPAIEAKPDTDFLDKHVKNFKKWRKNMAEEAMENPGGKDNLNPQTFAHHLNTHASNDAIFTLETGTSVIWASHHISFHSQRKILGSFNHGSMAVGLPSAIGAQFANRNREVWALCGDGAFNMSMQDFITAVKYKLALKILLFNNQELSFVKLEMEEAGLSPSLDALHETNFDFAQYAKLCGGDGIRVEKFEDVETAILKAKQSQKPFIIDAVVNSGALSFPPKIGFKEILGFGTSKVKETAQAVTGDMAQWENLKKELESLFK